MATPRFQPHSSFPQKDCLFLPSGWFWKMQIPRFLISKLDILDIPGLYVCSNSPMVSNREEYLGPHVVPGPNRTVELLGLQTGIAMIEVRKGGPGGELVITMQVEVVDLAGGQAWVALDANSVALNAKGTPVPYKLPVSTPINHSNELDLFKTVPAGTKNVVLSCHGQLKISDGIHILIAGKIGRSNCQTIFATLKPRAAGGVCWIMGCSVGEDNEFCKSASQASGCFIAAANITLPPIQPPEGKIELWFQKMKYFDPANGQPMAPSAFMDKQRELSFSVSP